MAQRFNSAQVYDPKPGSAKRTGASGGPNMPVRRQFGIWPFLLAIPVGLTPVFWLIKDRVALVLPTALAFVLVLVGAIALRRGLDAEHAYNQRKVAEAPGVPLKLFGAILLGAGTFLTAWFGAGYSMIAAVLFGVACAIGIVLHYGFDPREEKKPTVTGVSTREVTEALSEANALIDRLDTMRASLKPRDLDDQLGRIVQNSRNIVGIIEDDPRDLRRARRFLNVFLHGAEEAVDKYITTTARVGEAPELETKLRGMLTSLEGVTVEQRERLLKDDVTDLDVHLDVLSQRLEREGLV
ncbi:MAG: 5-bromo-4-chloroindolyl phosphate hydrolysis family protein [Geminicoccaceae bacterium]